MNVLQHEGTALSVQSQAISGLIIIAFFYLSWVGKYTIPTCNCWTCTIQFRCKNVHLWHLQQLLPHTAPLITLLLADGTTLYIDSQMHGSYGGIPSIILWCLGSCVLSKLLQDECMPSPPSWVTTMPPSVTSPQGNTSYCPHHLVSNWPGGPTCPWLHPQSH